LRVAHFVFLIIPSGCGTGGFTPILLLGRLGSGLPVTHKITGVPTPVFLFAAYGLGLHGGALIEQALRGSIHGPRFALWKGCYRYHGRCFSSIPGSGETFINPARIGIIGRRHVDHGAAASTERHTQDEQDMFHGLSSRWTRVALSIR
jgi:hypothetical protein